MRARCLADVWLPGLEGTPPRTLLAALPAGMAHTHLQGAICILRSQGVGLGTWHARALCGLINVARQLADGYFNTHGILTPALGAAHLASRDDVPSEAIASRQRPASQRCPGAAQGLSKSVQDALDLQQTFLSVHSSTLQSRWQIRSDTTNSSPRS